MKNLIYFSSLALILASCGEEKAMSLEEILASNDVKLINEKKMELTMESDKINEDLAKINA